MKIKYVAAASPEKVAFFFGSNLLSPALPSPLEPCFRADQIELMRAWRESQTSWCEDRIDESLIPLVRFLQRSGLASKLTVPTLFLAAHLNFHRDDAIQADRCIQSAVRIFAEESKLSDSCSQLIPDATCTLGVTEWLILALNSLIKSDMQSSLMWLHQAQRALEHSHCDSESPEQKRLHGDLHTLLACVAARSNELSESDKALAIAYRAHMEADSVRSACRDLLLSSRLATLQNQRARALSLLDGAECHLTLALSPREFENSPLVKIIHADRRSLQPSDEYSAASQWN